MGHGRREGNPHVRRLGCGTATAGETDAAWTRGLALAAIISIVVISLTAPTANAMAGSNSWLPTWLRVVGEVVFAVIVAVHLWHLRASAGRERAWHTGHVLMALGMMDMFAPTSHMIVAARIGKLVFAAAVIVSHIVGGPSALANALAVIYVLLRIGHMAAYIGDRQPLRSAAFTVAQLIAAAIFIIPAFR